MAGPLNVLAIADDLTGAAEIAGIGHRAGCTSAIVLSGGRLEFLDPVAPRIAVVDTDSRLRTPEEAAQLAASAAGAIPRPADARRPLVYKKTDSVLRGNPRAEIEAIAAVLGYSRILLVPCNPTAGRTIENGTYRVRGTPLAETEFGRDPIHPALTSDVRTRLGPGSLPVHIVHPGDALPPSGIVIGEASLPDDVVHWASQLDEHTLPAGGGEFFAAILATRIGHHGPGSACSPAPRPSGRTLIVSGSTAKAARQSCEWLQAHGIPLHALSETDLAAGRASTAWTAGVAASLGRHGVACIAVGRPLPEGGDTHLRIGAVFATAARALREGGAFEHVVLEGGATSAEVLTALEVGALVVRREWAQGVVTHEAQPGAPLAVTMKPGSYPWPDSLRSHFLTILSAHTSR